MGKGRKGGTDTRNRHTRGSIGQLGRQAASGPRKEGRRVSGVHTLGATKNPAGLNLRGVAGVIGIYLPLPAKAERTKSKVKSKQSPRYPRTRSKGFKVSSRR